MFVKTYFLQDCPPVCSCMFVNLPPTKFPTSVYMHVCKPTSYKIAYQCVHACLLPYVCKLTSYKTVHQCVHACLLTYVQNCPPVCTCTFVNLLPTKLFTSVSCTFLSLLSTKLPTCVYMHVFKPTSYKIAYQCVHACL